MSADTWAEYEAVKLDHYRRRAEACAEGRCMFRDPLAFNPQPRRDGAFECNGWRAVRSVDAMREDGFDSHVALTECVRQLAWKGAAADRRSRRVATVEVEQRPRMLVPREWT